MTYKRKIDKAEALTLLVRAVAERGEDYVDDRLQHQYFGDDGRPSCGVGLALSYVGATKDNVCGSNTAKVPQLAKCSLLPFELDPDAVKVLEKFRNLQDSRWKWGRCLEESAKV